MLARAATVFISSSRLIVLESIVCLAVLEKSECWIYDSASLRIKLLFHSFRVECLLNYYIPVERGDDTIAVYCSSL